MGFCWWSCSWCWLCVGSERPDLIWFGCKPGRNAILFSVIPTQCHAGWCSGAGVYSWGHPFLCCGAVEAPSVSIPASGWGSPSPRALLLLSTSITLTSFAQTSKVVLGREEGLSSQYFQVFLSTPCFLPWRTLSQGSSGAFYTSHCCPECMLRQWPRRPVGGAGGGLRGGP